eukprot:SAG31_NODE_39086_length_291_cov_0.791667_1_plen_97_part_11
MDRFDNPCTPTGMDVTVETPETYNLSLTESPEDRLARLEDLERRMEQLTQMGKSPDLAIQDPGLRQWLHTRLAEAADGQFVLDQIPTVSGQYIFFIT